jgi:hypothetical protein
MLARLDEPLARPEEEAADAPRAFDHLITQMRA